MLSPSVEGLSFYPQECDRFLASHINFCRLTGSKKKRGLALMWSIKKFSQAPTGGSGQRCRCRRSKYRYLVTQNIALFNGASYVHVWLNEHCLRSSLWILYILLPDGCFLIPYHSDNSHGYSFTSSCINFSVHSVLLPVSFSRRTHSTHFVSCDWSEKQRGSKFFGWLT
jgi:hypothetical protein